MALSKTVTIYHNSRCGKSRSALKVLQDAGIEFTIVDYLKNPPEKVVLKEIIKKLGVKPIDIIRQKESVFIEKFKGKSLTDDEWIDAMIQHPILIERPIVMIDSNAWIVRTDNALNHLKTILTK
ncbi:MAG: arsenate reductase (glutaredoxin) [Flavobacteriales bacterium]|nr:arsenate reductase (glutaredoxin) [Flavobacteriales bacterium]